MVENWMGGMSGTSTDGLDLCWLQFSRTHIERSHDLEGAVRFEWKAWEQIPYSSAWKSAIETSHKLADKERRQLAHRYAKWVANQLKQLPWPLKQMSGIGFHGPTVFHSVKEQISEQLTDFQALADAIRLPVIADFRKDDLLLNGRGAPLVPFGDEVLFPNYTACVNLGGFSNYSSKENNLRMASDASICNYAMDRIAQREGKRFDLDGEMACQGQVNQSILDRLNAEMAPLQARALSREWAEERIFPLLAEGKSADLLATLVEHCAQQLGLHLPGSGSVLLSGGGARNSFLVDRIKHHTDMRVEVASEPLIDMKEALIFAFLAFQKKHGRVNVMASATGAEKDHCAGRIFFNTMR